MSFFKQGMKKKTTAFDTFVREKFLCRMKIVKDDIDATEMKMTMIM